MKIHMCLILLEAYEEGFIYNIVTLKLIRVGILILGYAHNTIFQMVASC